MKLFLQSKHMQICFLGYSIKYLFILYLSDTCIIMPSSYFAISLIKQSNISKEQLAIFLFNISKEALHDYLNESKTLNQHNQHKLTKKKKKRLN